MKNALKAGLFGILTFVAGLSAFMFYGQGLATWLWQVIVVIFAGREFLRELPKVKL